MLKSKVMINRVKESTKIFSRDELIKVAFGLEEQPASPKANQLV
jgi:hypothetical protein